LTIYEKRRLGRDYQVELEQLIWLGLGKVLWLDFGWHLLS
jgi:hypothetical protein